MTQAPWLRAVLLVALCGLGTGAVVAQDFPSKPLTVVLTLPPGSTVDVLARTFGKELQARLGQAVNIDNKPGAGLVLGMQAVAAAPADGHTMAFTPATPVTIQLHRARKLSYARDTFIPVCQTFENVFFLAVPPSSPIKDFKSFMQQAQSRPGQIRYGHSGTASSPHLMGAELWRAAGVTLTDIPYRGETAFVADLMTGQVEAGMVTTALASQQKLRPLVVFSDKRSKWFPDVPTVAELGYQVPASGYGGLFVRAGTPAPALAKLEAECSTIVHGAAYQATAESVLQNATYLNRADFTKRLDDDSQSKAKLLSILNLPE
ncbi:MAG: tripartite tricarboxylate transporter substrate binding protein [Burkholderiales bacterium]|nr:tripartite tricarboxylate transporter substrate binding protein [Burkholderiales bacterium]